MIAAIDPGREKCGIAILRENGDVVEHSVIATVWLTEELGERIRLYNPSLLVIGNGTSSKSAQAAIKEEFPELPVQETDEYRTTDDAKRAYWEANPPTGWRRFFPTSMQVPPVPIDDYAAIILGQRYLINRR